MPPRADCARRVPAGRAQTAAAVLRGRLPSAHRWAGALAVLAAVPPPPPPSY